MLERETLKWFKPAKGQISTGVDTAARGALRRRAEAAWAAATTAVMTGRISTRAPRGRASQ